ncbi:MAG: phospho-N-acetylmuramoyl-pentapeptide-transferase [Bacteroidales bacterium]|nr:phospho-N-acetylmuramoyl-pentapeptide-transferase [Bacteroidales bacterium]MBD5212409.1 phospho-N-acetylmuramoyl-pentapeptide-transferase [Bacteroidales bacterium]MBD5217831.1 phospho-N-acetylmuramoyl-pentapeptide-transferase [Bacteroidales bacterium]MBD5221639.1 phospho-N-acetylmuramoyl-pentapeptide-transferase [Bacteroidales bacterium]
MLYALFQSLKGFDFPGSNLMGYLTFRTGVSFTLAMLIALFAGKYIIRRLQMMQVGEVVRNLGLEGQMKKTGTPTMGGILIIISIIVPALLIGNLSNIYMILMIIATLWMGAIGFLDDYRKLKYHNKDGLKGKYKITGQVGLGLLVGITMWLSPDIVVRKNIEVENVYSHQIEIVHLTENVKTPATTIPFVKNNNFNYEWLTSWIDNPHIAETLGWIVFVFVVIFVVTAVSNGANLTDGLDGLCAGTSATIGLALAVMAYLGGNVIYATYLNIMYIPGSEELAVYAGAFLGALIGFLWYNAFPAQVFMGDTGSLTLGGILAVFAILIRKELLIPLLCLVFFIEDLSVIMQVLYFKFTKKKYGEGRRIFKMTPLHHHFQKDADPAMKVLWPYPARGIAEPKIVTRFWIVSLLLATLTFVTLKIR